MFPFAFGVPLASQHNSPAAVNTSANVVISAPLGLQGSAVTEAPRKETYAEKKANWKSSLRRPHPFFSRDPGVGYQISRTNSATSRTGLIREPKDTNTKLSRPWITVRSMLMLAVMVLSVILLIIGLVYADQLNMKTTTSPANGSGTSLTSAGNTTTAAETKPETELLLREVTKRLVKRQEPTPIGQPTEAAKPASGDAHELMDEVSHKHSTAMLASVFFYVAALPLVSIIHAALDVVLFAIYSRLCRRHNRQSSSPSFIDDDDSFCESDAEDIDEEKFKHKLAYPALPISPEFKATLPERPTPKSRLQKLAPIIPLLSVISTVMIVEGWIIINGIQAHCELVPSGNKSKVCPSQFHHEGITSIKKLHNMSIARTMLSWMVVLLYIAQVVVTLKQNKIFSLRRLGIGKATEAQATSKAVSSAGSSPRTSRSILTQGRPRSNSDRRKTVRFDLEEASRRQSERGEDVQYIPAPSDGYDNGYGLAYNYSANYAYPKDGAGGDVRTPWQWQGQFEEFGNRGHNGNANMTNPVVAATLGAELHGNSIERPTNGSFDFGLASMRRMAQDENLALAKRSGFIGGPFNAPFDRNSPAMVNSSPSTVIPASLKSSREDQTRPLTLNGPTSGISAVVPFALATTAIPYPPRLISIRGTAPVSTDVHRNDTIVSAMTNGRTSIDLGVIQEEDRQDISPLVK